MCNWSDISTAPKDGTPHLRGMWVFSAATGKPVYFEVHCGYMDDEEGAFVTMDGYDDTGWDADDYDFWAEIPQPFPKAVKKGGD